MGSCSIWHWLAGLAGSPDNHVQVSLRLLAMLGNGKFQFETLVKAPEEQ